MQLHFYLSSKGNLYNCSFALYLFSQGFKEIESALREAKATEVVGATEKNGGLKGLARGFCRFGGWTHRNKNYSDGGKGKWATRQQGYGS